MDIEHRWRINPLNTQTNITFVIFYLKCIIFMQNFHYEYQAIYHFVEKVTSCHFIFNKK